MKKRNGISLIVLVITILVMIILAGVVILNMQENNPITKARQAKIKENANTYVQDMLREDLQVQGEQEESMLKDKVISGNEIKKYIPSIADADVNNFEIVNGKLAYIGKDKLEIEALKDTDVMVQQPFTPVVNQANKVIQINGVAKEAFGKLYTFHKTPAGITKIEVIDSNINVVKTHTMQAFYFSNKVDGLTDSPELYICKNNKGEEVVIGIDAAVSKSLVAVNVITGEEKRLASLGNNSNLVYATILPDNSVAAITLEDAKFWYRLVDANGNSVMPRKEIGNSANGYYFWSGEMLEGGEKLVLGATGLLANKTDMYLLSLDVRTGNTEVLRSAVGVTDMDTPAFYKMENGNIYYAEFVDMYKTHRYFSIDSKTGTPTLLKETTAEKVTGSTSLKYPIYFQEMPSKEVIAHSINIAPKFIRKSTAISKIRSLGLNNKCVWSKTYNIPSNMDKTNVMFRCIKQGRANEYTAIATYNKNVNGDDTLYITKVTL